MLKIVKNNGYFKRPDNTKWCLYYYDKVYGDMYAKIGLKPILGLFMYKSGLWRLFNK